MFHDLVPCSGDCGMVRDGGSREPWICSKCAQKATVRDWQEDMEICERLNQQYDHAWVAGQEEGSRIIRIYEIVPDEPCNFVAECENESMTMFILESRKALPYWLNEVKMLREQIASAALEKLTKGIRR